MRGSVARPMKAYPQMTQMCAETTVFNLCLLPTLNVAFPEVVQRHESPVRNGRRLLIAQVGRSESDGLVFPQAGVLGVAAAMKHGEGKHPVAHPEAPDALAGLFDLPRQYQPQDRPPRPPDTQHRPHQDLHYARGTPEAAPGETITEGDRRRMDPDQNLVVPRDRLLDVSDLQDFRRTVSRADGGFHAAVSVAPAEGLSADDADERR